MAPSESGGAPSSSRRLLRPKLRNATFVLPRTGQRLKGLVSLRDSAHGPNPPDNQGDSREERRGLLTGEIEPHHDGYGEWLSKQAQQLWARLLSFITSEQGIGVLKCSLAYLLGSMATFVPTLSAFLGHQQGKHMVATVTVYFHPARSRGSMYRALICAMLAFWYSAFLSITSMLVENFFQDTLDLPALGHAVVVIVFCGGGLGFVGWTKQRLGDPLVNVACSLTALSTITVLTKEGAVQSGDLSLNKIIQVLKMVIMGVVFAGAVSFTIFPISARKKLRANLITTTDTLAVMLALITESFLSGSEDELKSAVFIEAETKHKKAYSQLDKLIREAKLEHYFAGTEREYRLEKKLVRWVQDITHNMGGLRSAASLQFSLIRETLDREMQNSTGQSGPPHPTYYTSLERSWSFPDGAFLEPIDEQPEEESTNGGTAGTPDSNGGVKPTKQPLLPAEVFTLFISHLGPAMRSLAFTLKEIFNEIPIGPAPDYKVSVHSRLLTSLDRALDLYQESRERTLNSLYQQIETITLRTPEAQADLEEVSASCGHFSSSLLEFGEQLHDLLEILDQLQLELDERPGGRSWNWLKFWRKKDAGMSDPLEILEPLRADASIPAPASIRPTSPSENTVKQRLGYRIWKSFRWLRRDDTRFAIKVGAGAALYALPAFLPSTRPFYQHWRGEWGLLSYMLVCSMYVGASNTVGSARFLGTCLGAVLAILAWYISQGNAIVLAIFGWLMAIWISYITIVQGNGPLGRFIMLTYNLSVLYAYSLTQEVADGDKDEGGQQPVIGEIALHRVVAVLSGCLWGVIITRLIWPIRARDRLKDSLSMLWLRLSLIWRRNPLSAMVETRKAVAYLTARERLEFERFLTRLETLLASARSEFELRSAFPAKTYTNIIQRTRSMVNALNAMNLELMKTETATDGEISLLRYTATERHQLSARISHLLSVMASSMKLEYPLNDVLPSIDHARDRLLARIYRYRQDNDVSLLTTEEESSLLYSYILVTGQFSQEIHQILADIGQLFGVWSEDMLQLA
ncbi:Uncharacterized protein PECH_001791 [Penicillium ucsense]|uniref:DUF2421 domain-containing protein n=1 Tax=Penicillium ucsense TaxID=2839758 RepID=A0A8J8WC46_9EURO|nr:Uncharacterized protein PECM_008089 [Penicillium ucsense]KAF7738140.1 Uncharacterized protein PECH_001791 [Penicillium ucsense]